MGGNLSTRKITLINDEKSGIIKLSDNLAQRLKGQLEDAEQQPPKSPKKAFIPPPPPPPSPPPPSADPIPPAGGAAWDEGRSDPWSGLYAEEGRRALLRLQEEQNQAIAAVHQQWQQKMKQREDQWVETSKLSTAELQRTAEEVEAAFVKSSVTHVCHDCQSAVLKCYQDHPKQTLLCADAVQKFTRCVDLTRLQSVTKEDVRQRG
ncbi:hypothetical protein FHG87_003511 [Trinorchestia longiramus]|nr:hypothetical protein FHG87_003511 [Trinorchestia longiramus]